MKVVSYNPNEIKNVPQFFNKYIEESPNDEYIMFVFNDILEAVKDKNELVSKYQSLMKICDLPFVFYPYYLHFNKIFPESISKENPRAHVYFKNHIVFDFVSQPAYGLLILDLNKLRSINFKFDEQYKLSFYIQDLIQTCYTNKLWISNSYFLDIFNSYTMFNSNFKVGYSVEPKQFNEEKEIFFKNHKIEPEPANTFVDNLKKKYEAFSKVENTEAAQKVEIKEETKETVSENTEDAKPVEENK